MRKLATLLMMVFALSAKAQQTPSYQHTIDLGIGLWIPGHTDPGMIDNRPVDETLHKMPIPSVTYQYMMNRHWSLGASASLLHYSQKMKYNATGETADKKSETEYRISVMSNEDISVKITVSQEEMKKEGFAAASAKATFKVIGSGLGGITQMILILSVSLLSFHTINMDNAFTRQILEYVNFSLDTVLYAILFFILGYFIYSFLLGALSSLASRSEDLNTLITPVMMLYVAAFIVVLMCMNSDQINGPVMIVCSYIPFTAPIAMFVRIVMSDVSVIEVIISVCVQLFSIYLFGMLAAAIYRIGVLLYGKTPKPSELVKLLKEQHKNRQALKKRQS